MPSPKNRKHVAKLYRLLMKRLATSQDVEYVAGIAFAAAKDLDDDPGSLVEATLAKIAALETKVSALQNAKPASITYNTPRGL